MEAANHDLRKYETDIFLHAGLDDPNQLERTSEIRFFAHMPSALADGHAGRRSDGSCPTGKSRSRTTAAVRASGLHERNDMRETPALSKRCPGYRFAHPGNDIEIIYLFRLLAILPPIYAP